MEISLEWVMGIGFTTLSAGVGYAVTFVNKMNQQMQNNHLELVKKIAELDKKIIIVEGDANLGKEKLKSHIYNCTHYKPRQSTLDD